MLSASRKLQPLQCSNGIVNSYNHDSNNKILFFYHFWGVSLTGIPAGFELNSHTGLAKNCEKE